MCVCLFVCARAANLASATDYHLSIHLLVIISVCPFPANSTRPSPLFFFTFPSLFIDMRWNYHKSNRGTHQIYNSSMTLLQIFVAVLISLSIFSLSLCEATSLPLLLSPSLSPKSINTHRLSQLLFLAVNHLYIPSDKPFLLVQPPIYHHPCHLACNFIALQLLQGPPEYVGLCTKRREREREGATDPLQGS